MVPVTALRIDAELSLGPKKILCGVFPIHEYTREGKKTDKITGFRYEIALPSLAFEKVNVRVPGEQMVAVQGDEPLFVEFDNLEITLFDFKGKTGFTAKATGVSVAKSQSIEKESRATRAKNEAYPS